MRPRRDKDKKKIRKNKKKIRKNIKKKDRKPDGLWDFFSNRIFDTNNTNIS